MPACAAPPQFLSQILREGNRNSHRAPPASPSSGDNWVFRRCAKQLPLVWNGLREYTGRALESRMDWDDCITAVVLHRWYASFSRVSHTTAQSSTGALRWTRYTLNRLLPKGGVRVTDTRNAQTSLLLPDIGGRGLTLNPLLTALRLPHQAEAVVSELLADESLRVCTPRERYALRRFVSAAPLWHADAFLRAGVGEDDVAWFVDQRMHEAVPACKHGWFAAALRSLVSHVTSRGVPSPAPHRRTTPLLYTQSDGVDVQTCPIHVMIFFRHFCD